MIQKIKKIIEYKISPSVRHFLDLPATAYLVPFFTFMLILNADKIPYIKYDHTYSPWWRKYPEHWIYPIQSIVCFILILYFWRRYKFSKPTLKNCFYAFVFSLVGISCWVLPAVLYKYFSIGADLPEILKNNLGFVIREEGFNPYIFDEFWKKFLVITMRLFRMVIVVAFIEEIFWRGFLMRFLINNDNFKKIKFGTYTHLSFWLTFVLFVSVHSTEDRLGAVIYALLMGVYTIKFKDLTGCIIMHGISNLFLGIFILKTNMFGFW